MRNIFAIGGGVAAPILVLTLFLIVACNSPNPTNDTDTEDSDNLIDEPMTDTEQSDVDNGEMVAIPAGKFNMGCNDAVDDQCMAREKPYHEIILSAFLIDQHEVTVEEFRQCVDDGACANGEEQTPLYNTGDEFANCNYGIDGKDHYPMNCVSWQGATTYCVWAGKRLPTEAEWEKAARGTDGRLYPWGNEPTASCDYAVMGNAEVAGSTGCDTGGTWPVESKKAGGSPYNVYDMAGNVWEWVNDWYGANYYSASPLNDPQGPTFGDYHVVRGGSWLDGYPFYMRTSARYYFPDNGGRDGGFRCAR